MSSLGAAFSLHGVIRTRFFDDHLLGAANAGCSQVVLLAAHQAVPRCRRTVVPADLREDWPAMLTANGFQRTRPTAWLAEGCSSTLPPSGRQSADRGGSAVRPRQPAIAFEHDTIAGSPLLSRARATPAMDELTWIWKGGLGADAPDWLVRRGWWVEIHDRSGALSQLEGVLATVHRRHRPPPLGSWRM